IREPVFSLQCSADLQASLLDGIMVKGTLEGGARVADGAVELGSAGLAAFAHRPEFDIPRAFSFETWVRIDRETQMPVVLCCGAYQRDGWFLQRYGRGWRWHLAPTSCDGGKPVVGRWTHLAGTYDGSLARLYQDGKLVASAACRASLPASGLPLVIGQYGSRGPDYQVDGAVAGLKIYHRALAAEEIAATAAEPMR
ncbi:MAG: LamG domain-containing protein, partial [Thermoguttaceae bacterium]